MSANALIGAEVKVVAEARASWNSTTEAAMDFDAGTGGTQDIYLPDHLGNKYHNAKLLLVVTADAGSGSTDKLSILLYDATAGTSDWTALSASADDYDYAASHGPDAASGNRNAVIGIRPKKPYLRVALDADGTTDTFVVHAVVMALPGSLV